MSLPLVSALVWLVAANLIAMLPSRDHHWRAAYGLIAVGIPALGWVTATHGPMAGVVFLVAGMSVLRWPVWYLWLWITGRRRG
jgi:hypothetical protein